jgi:hypothetical protein
VPLLELLALVLDIPGSLASLRDLLARRFRGRKPARPVRIEPSGNAGRAANPRTIELAITLRLRLRRT